MKRTTKIVGLTAAAIVAAGTIGWQAFAQTPMGGPHGSGMGMRHGMTMGMRDGHGSTMAGGMLDPTARLADLKADIGITANQQPAWDDYANTLSASAAKMTSQHEGMDMGAMHGLSEQDRQARMTQMREQHATASPAVKAAAETLLAVLDDAQKAKARDILPGLSEHGPGMMPQAGMSAHGGRHGRGAH